MRSISFFALLWILISSSTYGQRKKVIEADRKSFAHAFYLRPLNAIDYSQPRISAGYEKMNGPRKFLSFTTSIYIHNYYTSRPDARFINFKPRPSFGVSGELEQKWFRKKLFYYAAAFHVGNLGYFSSHYFGKTTPQGEKLEDVVKFNVNKWWAEPNAKMGWRIRPTDRLFLDFYLGAGIRFKHTEHVISSAGEGFKMLPDVNLFYYRDRPGFHVGPTFKTGINFGYKFNTRTTR